MKVIFEEWPCSYLSDEEKGKIENIVKSALIDRRNRFQRESPTMKISLFEVPHTQELNGSCEGEKGEILCEFTVSTAEGHNFRYKS